MPDLGGRSIVKHTRLLAVCAWLGAASPALAADLGYAEPPPPADKWQFSLTPYAWMINVNGDVTAAGQRVDINDSFFEIVEKSDSILAWMSYFERARAGSRCSPISSGWISASPAASMCAAAPSPGFRRWS